MVSGDSWGNRNTVHFVIYCLLCLLKAPVRFGPFSLFVWVSDASSAPPDHDRVGDFQPWWPLLWILGRGCSFIFPSAVLMLRTASFKNLRSLFAGFPPSCSCWWHCELPRAVVCLCVPLSTSGSVWEKREKNLGKPSEVWNYKSPIDWKYLPLSSWYFSLQLGS